MPETVIIVFWHARKEWRVLEIGLSLKQQLQRFTGLKLIFLIAVAQGNVCTQYCHCISCHLTAPHIDPHQYWSPFLCLWIPRSDFPLLSSLPWKSPIWGTKCLFVSSTFVVAMSQPACGEEFGNKNTSAPICVWQFNRHWSSCTMWEHCSSHN